MATHQMGQRIFGPFSDRDLLWPPVLDPAIGEGALVVVVATSHLVFEQRRVAVEKIADCPSENRDGAEAEADAKARSVSWALAVQGAKTSAPEFTH